MGNTKTIDSNSNSSSSEATASSPETILKQEQQVEKKSGIKKLKAKLSSVIK